MRSSKVRGQQQAQEQQATSKQERMVMAIPTGRSGGGRGDMVRCADCGTLAHVEPLSLFLNIVDWRRGIGIFK